MNYSLIVDLQIAQEIAIKLLTEDVLAIDTETTGLDPYNSKIRLLQISNKEHSYLFDCFVLKDLSFLKDIFENQKPVKIFHNAKFDIKFLKVHFGFNFENIFDTMLASQIISSGDHSGGHSLADVTKRYLNITLDKSSQLSDWSKELTEKQLEYASKDVLTLHPLREKLRNILIEQKLVKVAKLEFDCCIAVADMELNGCYLDREQWMKIVYELEKKHSKLSNEIQSELSQSSKQISLFDGFNSININSTQQLAEALHNMGIKVDDTSEATLLHHKNSHPIIEKILEYRGLQKSISSYGANVLEYINKKTGRIHADFSQLRTDTGRFSCSNPNLQQIPATAEYRACFRAEKGNKLITADYSQVELRILAELSQDREFIKAFESGEDLHKATASSMFNVPLSEVNKDMRSQAKSINFGLAYGRGASSLAEQIGTSTEKAKELINKYFSVYDGIKRWLDDAAKYALKHSYSRTLSNRIRRYTFNPHNRGEIASIERQGKNSPIQGTSADITKQALVLINSSLKNTNIRLINTVHDEIILEAPEEKAEYAAQLLESKMIEAARVFLKKVPIVVDVSIADFWTK
jgi:DNA polymerase-1